MPEQSRRMAVLHLVTLAITLALSACGLGCR